MFFRTLFHLWRSRFGKRLGHYDVARTNFITLPTDLDELFNGGAAFRGLTSAAADKADFRFLRFRPPQLEREGIDEPVLPHIRLDRALQFLIGDRLQ